MQRHVNCDLGEGFGDDAAIMPLIQAANIACGFHAGDTESMRITLRLAKQHGVAAGAHPSYADRNTFGRRELHVQDGELFECIKSQLHCIADIAAEENIKLTHVKPHGALYNVSARNPAVAALIARAVKAFDPSLVLYGLSGSCSLTEADKLGLRVAHEVFADRGYADDGSLLPRTHPLALHTETKQVVKQVLQIVQTGIVRSCNGLMIPIKADTICIHGDGPNALVFAKAIHEALQSLSA